MINTNICALIPTECPLSSANFSSTLTEHICCSLTQSCLTLCNPMDCSTPGFPALHQLPEFAQTHVHGVDAAIQPSLSTYCMQNTAGRPRVNRDPVPALGGLGTRKKRGRKWQGSHKAGCDDTDPEQAVLLFSRNPGGHLRGGGLRGFWPRGCCCHCQSPSWGQRLSPTPLIPLEEGRLHQ